MKKKVPTTDESNAPGSRWKMDDDEFRMWLDRYAKARQNPAPAGTLCGADKLIIPIMLIDQLLARYQAGEFLAKQPFDLIADTEQAP